MSPVVRTVKGDVNPDVLGRTLTHEHLSAEFGHFYRKPPTEQLDSFEKNEITLDSLGDLRQYPYSSKYNLNVNDDSAFGAVSQDVELYKNYGGGTIVENTTESIGRNIKHLYILSENTGVNIVAGTGFYIADTQPQNYIHYSKEDMYNYMMKDLIKGCRLQRLAPLSIFADECIWDSIIVRAGFMGEIASVWPLRNFEIKAIRAAGEVQEKIGCGVSFHPHPHCEAPFEIMRLYLEAGGKADKAVMSHLDRTLLENEKLLEFAEFGTYCQFDLFGVEVSYYQLNVETDMPSDAQRIEKIRILVDEGKEDKVLMSHDIHTKHRLTAFGGHGYSHIINNVLPKMKSKGFSQSTIDKITIENPAKWLTIPKPE